MNKEQTAEFVASLHFRINPGITRIFRIVSRDDSNESQPIRLLEVNSETIEAGVMPVGLPAAPDRGVDYSFVVVELSPSEFNGLESGDLELPADWKIGPEIFPSAVAGAAS